MKIADWFTQAFFQRVVGSRPLSVLVTKMWETICQLSVILGEMVKWVGRGGQIVKKDQCRTVSISLPFQWAHCERICLSTININAMLYLPIQLVLCALCIDQYLMKIVSVFAHELSICNALLSLPIQLVLCALCINLYLWTTVVSCIKET